MKFSENDNIYVYLTDDPGEEYAIFASGYNGSEYRKMLKNPPDTAIIINSPSDGGKEVKKIRKWCESTNISFTLVARWEIDSETDASMWIIDDPQQRTMFSLAWTGLDKTI